jgi:hypothetical protein
MGLGFHQNRSSASQSKRIPLGTSVGPEGRKLVCEILPPKSLEETPVAILSPVVVFPRRNPVQCFGQAYDAPGPKVFVEHCVVSGDQLLNKQQASTLPWFLPDSHTASYGHDSHDGDMG